ncbi:MAG: YciI family protein [Pantoea sp.]|uniref:YciI family protein n=1 Tax=Pantoea sp. TaxID=69393 RepID=UPI0023A2DA46|nr:YciI family protein [Pantoea sp.]MDE1187199.1 YciI family protein [Pantoea sp.]
MMGIYVVRMDHPDGTEWNAFVREHVVYLKVLINQGKLLASGPLKNTPLRAGFLVFQADTLDEVQAMVNTDPFAREDLIAHLDIQKWDPLFGELNRFSSRTTASELQDLVD